MEEYHDLFCKYNDITALLITPKILNRDFMYTSLKQVLWIKAELESMIQQKSFHLSISHLAAMPELLSLQQRDHFAKVWNSKSAWHSQVKKFKMFKTRAYNRVSVVLVDVRASRLIPFNEPRHRFLRIPVLFVPTSAKINEYRAGSICRHRVQDHLLLEIVLNSPAQLSYCLPSNRSRSR